jgi:cell division septum initiation protein DivIVA
VTDNRMKDRVKVMLGTSPDGATSEHALVSTTPVPGLPAGLPNQALQVLTMAQRTAEEHVATAHQQADKIRTDALAAAEQIARDAQIHAHNVRREADKVLFDARAVSEQNARDARAAAEVAQRNADKIVADAQARADSIAAEAHSNAEHLRVQAQQRFDDVVGSLGTKREALQEQIEALEQFDREYRGRLTSFMQGQLRALWVDQPQVTGELESPEDSRPGRHGTVTADEPTPALRQEAVTEPQPQPQRQDDASPESEEK